jgi:hypothetical protein
MAVDKVSCKYIKSYLHPLEKICPIQISTVYYGYKITQYAYLPRVTSTNRVPIPINNIVNMIILNRK